MDALKLTFSPTASTLSPTNLTDAVLSSYGLRTAPPSGHAPRRTRGAWTLSPPLDLLTTFGNDQGPFDDGARLDPPDHVKQMIAHRVRGLHIASETVTPKPTAPSDAKRARVQEEPLSQATHKALKAKGFLGWKPTKHASTATATTSTPAAARCGTCNR